jgi:ABC-2 type transport system permease protein
MIDETVKHLRIYLHYFKLFLKTRLVYKWDASLSMLNNFLSLASSIAIIIFLFTQIESLNGWSFWELIFLTSFFRVALSITNFLFFAPVFLGEDFIVPGDLDRVLLRPLNPLFQVYSDKINIHSFAEATAAFLVGLYSLYKISWSLSAEKLLFGISSLLSSTILLTAIFLFLGSMAFWTGRSRSFFTIVWRVRDLAQYPLKIYPGALKSILTTLIPVAFASFYPATFLLEKQASIYLQLSSLIAGPFFFLLAYQFWRIGLSRYSSTGS